MQPALYINLCEDVLFSSNANGTPQTAVLTPKKYWGLGLNLTEMVLGLRIRNLTPGGTGKVTIKWQWSLDGSTWLNSSMAAVVQTADGDTTHPFNTASQLMPWSRLILSVEDTGTSQITAQISAWSYCKYGR